MADAWRLIDELHAVKLEIIAAHINERNLTLSCALMMVEFHFVHNMPWLINDCPCCMQQSILDSLNNETSLRIRLTAMHALD